MASYNLRFQPGDSMLNIELLWVKVFVKKQKYWVFLPLDRYGGSSFPKMLLTFQ